MRASIAVSRTPDGLAAHLELSRPTICILQFVVFEPDVSGAARATRSLSRGRTGVRGRDAQSTGHRVSTVIAKEVSVLITLNYPRSNKVDHGRGKAPIRIDTAPQRTKQDAAR